MFEQSDPRGILPSTEVQQIYLGTWPLPSGLLPAMDPPPTQLSRRIHTDMSQGVIRFDGVDRGRTVPHMSDDLTAGLAVAGLVLALISLMWQLWFTHRVDRARLHTTISRMTLVTPGEVTPTGVPHTEDAIGIAVINVGRRATVLQSINPVLGKRHRIRGRAWPKRWRPKYELLPYVGADLSVISTRLPVRLEPGDEANVYISVDQLARAMRGRADRRVRALAGSSTAGTRWSRAIAVPPSDAPA